MKKDDANFNLVHIRNDVNDSFRLINIHSMNMQNFQNIQIILGYEAKLSVFLENSLIWAFFILISLVFRGVENPPLLQELSQNSQRGPLPFSDLLLFRRAKEWIRCNLVGNICKIPARNSQEQEFLQNIGGIQVPTPVKHHCTCSILYSTVNSGP